MSYTNNGSATPIRIVDNVTNCGANSCWHLPPLARNYQFTSVSVGADGYVCGITTDRSIICRTEYPDNAWSSLPQPMSSVYGIAVGDQSSIWVLSGICSLDPAAGYSVWQLSANSWIQRSGCGSTIAFDEADGFVYLTDGHNNIYVSSDSASSWTQLPGSGTQIAAAPGLIALVGTDSHAYISLAQASSGWKNPSCGPTAPGGVGFAKLALDQEGNLFGIDTGGKVYFCGQSWSTSAWNKVAVPLTGWGVTPVLSIATANPLTTWAVIGTTYTPGCRQCATTPYIYRFSAYGVQLSATLSGSGTCSGCFANGQCCPVTHSGYNQVGWAGPHISSVSGTSSATIGPNGGGFSTTTTSTLLDVFDCLESDASCTPQVAQEVTCSAMGQIYSNNPVPVLPHWEIAKTNAVWTPALGEPTCQEGIFFSQCQYPVIDNCTAGTSPPDLIMTGGRVNWAVSYGGEQYISWNAKALCISQDGHKPWFCSKGVASLFSVNIPVTQQLCTYNP